MAITACAIGGLRATRWDMQVPAVQDGTGRSGLRAAILSTNRGNWRIWSGREETNRRDRPLCPGPAPARDRADGGGAVDLRRDCQPQHRRPGHGRSVTGPLALRASCNPRPGDSGDSAAAKQGELRGLKRMDLLLAALPFPCRLRQSEQPRSCGSRSLAPRAVVNGQRCLCLQAAAATKYEAAIATALLPAMHGGTEADAEWAEHVPLAPPCQRASGFECRRRAGAPLRIRKSAERDVVQVESTMHDVDVDDVVAGPEGHRLAQRLPGLPTAGVGHGEDRANPVADGVKIQTDLP